MISELVAASQSVKALSELLRAASDLKNFNEFVTAISEVNAKLLEAQSAALISHEKQSAMLNRIGELETEIAKLKHWESESERYQLTEIAFGVFAHRLKPGLERGEPQHMLCANCFSKQEKRILQLRNRNAHGSWYVCHNCNSELSIKQST